MGSSKNNNRTINACAQILQRLNQALNFGFRDGRTWQCPDIQIQRQVIRSVSAFIDSIAVQADTLHHSGFKDTVCDAVSALVWILEHTNTATLSIAAETTLKFVSALPASILKSCVLDLVSPLSSLIPCHQTEVAMSCVKALSLTLQDVSSKNEKTVWDVLNENEIVCYCTGYLQTFSFGVKSIENFQLMISLLSTILQRFPESRYLVWSNANLMRTLINALENPDSCCKVEVLQLLSAIALCGSGATKLIENKESFIKKMVKCMDSLQPQPVQVEAFKLARYLAVMIMNEERFSKIRSLCCEPVVQAIICGMSKVSTKSGEVSRAETSMVLKASCLASITRWGGEHHAFLWKHGIGDVLLDLLLENSRNQLDQNSRSLETQFSTALACLNSKCLPVLRNYVWEILGWLAIHSKKGFEPEGDGHKLSICVLILSACLTFVDSSHQCHKLCQIHLHALQSELATRAVLMMIYSPSEYISSKARSILTELLKMNGRRILERFLSTLKFILSRDSFDRQLLSIYAMTLACYIGLPEYRSWVLEFSGLNVLLTLVRKCISNGIDAQKQSFSPYMHNSFCGRTCCDVSSKDWEGKDSVLFYSMWSVAELIKYVERINDGLEISSGGMKFSIPELVKSLQDICTKVSASGVRWFASYALSSLGLYGFPQKLATRIEKVLLDTYYTDVTFVLKSGERLSAHSVILAIRCPSLLRLGDETSHISTPISTGKCGEFHREIRLSGSIDHQLLQKFLNYVYLGYLQAREEHTSLLKPLAKHCNLQSLQHMLCQKRPNWGTPYPSFDLSLALGPLGHRFSDVIFETKTNELPGWTCNFCSSLVPHMHVHKVIMMASSDFFRALFTSGMQESLLQTIKLDVSWEAMVKLIAWSYTDELPNPPTGCLWGNMSNEEKLRELEPYLELCSVARRFCMEDVEVACFNVVTSYLDSETQLLSIKIIKIAVDFTLWDLVDVALTHVAPYYRQLYDSGELEDLDETIIDMIRAASVQYTHRR